MDQDLNLKSGNEIEEALQKFQAEKEKEEQKKQPSKNVSDLGDSKMVQFLIKNGLAQNSKQANIILFILALLMFLTSIYFFLKGLKF